MHDEVFRNEVHCCLQLTSKKKEKMDQWVNGGTENRQVCEETNMATC